LSQIWKEKNIKRPYVILGGPEISFLPRDAEILCWADYIVQGEGEISFKKTCKEIFANCNNNYLGPYTQKIIKPEACSLEFLKSAYKFYTEKDLRTKLIYVESSRGCPFTCAFCQSAKENLQREFPLEPFLAEMETIIEKIGVAKEKPPVIKFLDRSFNANSKRAVIIADFFIKKIREKQEKGIAVPFTVHFEMAPWLFSCELIDVLGRFPFGTLRLEIGIQTLNPETRAIIGRPFAVEKELLVLKTLIEKTNAIIHVDLIAGLPCETEKSFKKGFDVLWETIYKPQVNIAEKQKHNCTPGRNVRLEVQLGILKVLPGTRIADIAASFGILFNSLPPYEVTATDAWPEENMFKIKNFARFWELTVNRGLWDMGPDPVFDRFMEFSCKLFARFGRSYGIDKKDILAALGTASALSTVSALGTASALSTASALGTATDTTIDIDAEKHF
jgi:radical SAM superfamily enzyme YgiQ (UPF0313 family)